MEKYSRIKALISLDAIRYNFEQMKKNIKEGTKIIAVIKAGCIWSRCSTYCENA